MAESFVLRIKLKRLGQAEDKLEWRELVVTCGDLT